MTVIINDRGPKNKDREFDVSLKAAKVLGITHTGVAYLEYEILGERGLMPGVETKPAS